MERTLSLVAVPLAILAASAPAQFTATIAAGTATTSVSSQSSWRRCVAILPTGTMWTLVRETDAAGSHLYLTASPDGGRTWGGRFDVPTVQDGNGAIAADRRCGRLHVAWNANDAASLADVYHQEFDTLTGAWLGQPTRLTNATGANDQYYANDVAVTEQGTVVVVLSTHRGPPTSIWRSGWSAGILVRRAGAAAFDPVRPVNTDLYGQRPDVQIVGEVAHLAFRTNAGLYGTRYRAFDTASATFVTPTDVQVDQGTSNVSQIAADASGGLYVCYAYGGTSAGTGEIRVAYSPPGNPTSWAVQMVAADPDLVRGNVADQHYSLCGTGTDVVWAAYSKRTAEQHRNLYLRPYRHGLPLGPEVLVWATNDADRFLFVGGVRNSESQVGPLCVVESRAAVHVGNLVELFAANAPARGTRHGVGCGGAAAPTLHTVDWPWITTGLTLEIAGGTPNLPAALLISGSCLASPIDLGAVGMPGCTLDLAAPAAAGLALDPAGTARFTITPPTPLPYAGVPFQLQAVVVAPGANAVGARTSNAQTVIFE